MKGFFKVLLFVLCRVWLVIAIMAGLWVLIGAPVPIAILDGNLWLMKWLTAGIAKLGSAPWLAWPYEYLDKIVEGIKWVTQSRTIRVPGIGEMKISLGPNVELIGRVVAEGIPLYLELKAIRFLVWLYQAPGKFKAWQARRHSANVVPLRRAA